MSSAVANSVANFDCVSTFSLFSVLVTLDLSGSGTVVSSFGISDSFFVVTCWSLLFCDCSTFSSFSLLEFSSTVVLLMSVDVSALEGTSLVFTSSDLGSCVVSLSFTISFVVLSEYGVCS
ncbi:Uncharacterised protein [Staphylococcus xylosus]|nr:Uncharacterised protein [Staphylococcus xylosus]